MKVECSKCHDAIESLFRREFVTCKCGACFVDGGDECPRAGGPVVTERIPMKIRNKHTKEVVTWEHGLQYGLGKEYHSIKEFAEDWEDVEVSLPGGIRTVVGAWLAAQPFKVDCIECNSEKTYGGYINYLTAVPKHGWESVDLDICTTAPLFLSEKKEYTPEELGIEL